MHKFFAKTQFLGKKVYFLPQCHSTNEELQLMLSKRAVLEGEIVITSNQTKGKGQRGNTWESEEHKNLILSIALKPSFLKISDQFGLHIITSLAIHDALFALLGSKMKIKWPNDIYYQDNKIAGILIENSIRKSSIEHSVVGIGLNINQLNFQTDNATSLAEITMQEFEVNDIAEKILIHLEKRYLQLKSGQIEKLKNDYLTRMYKYNESQHFKDSDSTYIGEIIGITKTGKLLIQNGDKMHSYDFKEVEFLRN